MDKDKSFDTSSTERNDIVIGRNSVTEALKTSREIDSILIAKGQKGGSISTIIKKAKDKGIPVKEVDGKKLDFMCAGAVHQGVIAMTAVKEYSQLEDIFELAKSKNEDPFIIICDELTDPHNLGAILRTADCSGAHGVIIPKRRSVTLNYTVGKSSAGAIEYVPVVKVNNLASTIDKLKDLGVFIYSTDMEGQDCFATDFSGAVALVIGSEGKGVQRLILDKSDFVVSLPVAGHINSLNASVACGIFCYEILRQRKKQ